MSVFWDNRSRKQLGKGACCGPCAFTPGRTDGWCEIWDTLAAVTIRWWHSGQDSERREQNKKSWSQIWAFGRAGFYLFRYLLGRIPWGCGHEEKRSSGILVESCLTCLVAFCDDMTGLVHERKVVDVFCLNFNKGFLHCHNVKVTW